eukprot:6204342-Pleurochrysis_carterae.AAC.3
MSAAMSESPASSIMSRNPYCCSASCAIRPLEAPASAELDIGLMLQTERDFLRARVRQVVLERPRLLARV